MGRVPPGQVIERPGDAIHSVLNEGERTTLSLHVEGRNRDFTERSRIDPDTCAETQFKLKLQ